jgi:hypothetical protein
MTRLQALIKYGARSSFATSLRNRAGAGTGRSRMPLVT